MLDDAVEAVQRRADGPWQQTSWGLLQPEISGPGASATQHWRVRLRADLQSLQVRAGAVRID